MEWTAAYVFLLAITGFSCHLLDNSTRNLATNSLTALNRNTKTQSGENNTLAKLEENLTLKNKTTSATRGISLVKIDQPISVKVLHGEENALSISDTSNKRLPEILKRNNLNVYSIDYLYNESLVFFAAYDKIFRATLEGKSNISDPQVIVASEVDGPVRLAVDWVHSRLYWMADKYQTVMTSDLDGRKRKLLFDNIKNFSFPNNIVVDPYEGKIFFVSNYAVYTSDLSGGNVTLVHLEGNSPGEEGRGVRCVALDRANHKLYFSGRNHRESYSTFYLARANYDGSEVDDFNTTGVNDIYSMDVLGDTLYFAQHKEEVCHDELLSVKTTSLVQLHPKKIFVPSRCKDNMWNIKVFHPCVQIHLNDEYCSGFYV